MWINQEEILVNELNLQHDKEGRVIKVKLFVINSSQGYNADKLAKALGSSSPTDLVPDVSGRSGPACYGHKTVSFSLDGRNYEELDATLVVKHAGSSSVFDGFHYILRVEH